MQKHPQQMSVRQLVPPTFVLGLLSSVIVAVLGAAVLGVVDLTAGGPVAAFLGMLPFLPFLLFGIYLLSNLFASGHVARQHGWQYLPILLVVYTVLHLSYGTGFLVGLGRFAARWKAWPIPAAAPATEPQAAPQAAAHARLPLHLRSIGTLFDAALRRTMDVIVSLVGLLVLSPLFLGIAILMKRDSPGSIFYRGPRVGKNGQVFQILKFRTMYEQAEDDEGPRVTAQDDPRITPTGRILRESKLNELPQLWNVLVGEMSLVGPRPEDPQIAARWPGEVQHDIFSVRPGITSPASVIYRNEETLLHSGNVMGQYLKDILPTKLRLDQLYVRNRSILSDLDVILWTALLLLPRLKRATVPEHLLYWGPLSRFIDRYLVWFLIDLIVAIGAIGTAGVIWRIGAPLDLGIEKASGIALVIAILFSLINTLMGLNQVNWKRSRTMDAMDLALSSGAVTVLLFVLNLLWPGEPLLPPSMLVVAGTIAFIGFVIVRYRSRLFIEVFLRRLRLPGAYRMSAVGERILIVGSGDMGQMAARLIRDHLSQAFNIIGMVDDDPRMIGQQIDGCKVIGNTPSIPDLVEKHDIGLILFSISRIRPPEQARILALCRSTPARVMHMPEIISLLNSLFPTGKGNAGRAASRENAHREQMVDQFLSTVSVDGTTGLYDRSGFLRVVGQELPRARRYGRPLSIVIFSLETRAVETGAVDKDTVRTKHVKTRPVGYKTAAPPRSEASGASVAIDLLLLKDLASRLQQNIRQVDILGHYDGNQVVLALPETGRLGAKRTAERLAQRLSETPIQTGLSSYQVTVKVGIATLGDSIPRPGMDGGANHGGAMVGAAPAPGLGDLEALLERAQTTIGAV